MTLKEKYGEWAFVGGGSEGMGGEWCNKVASEGMNVVVTGRHKEVVDAKVAQLKADYGVEARGITIDFGEIDAPVKAAEAVKDLEIGLLIYNAGLASMELFPDRDVDFEMYRLNVNVRSGLYLALTFSKGMAQRHKGGIILMSSTAGLVGTPYVQTYSATKAYNLTLAEALWAELKPFGIDVMAVIPGNTIGQNFKEVPAGTPGYQTGAEVVAEALEAFGTEPNVITGEWNRQQMAGVFSRETRKAYVLQMASFLESIREEHGTGAEAEKNK